MKTVKDFKNILEEANPNGFVMVFDEKTNKGAFITMPSNLNITTYGYVDSNGRDITDGKKDGDIVGLPFYGEELILQKDHDSDQLGDVKHNVEPMMRYKSIFSIKKFLDNISKFPDDSPLVLFDGHYVKKMSFNGEYQVCYVTYRDGKQCFKHEPKDFVILVRGEKLKHTYKGDKVNESNIVKLNQKDIVKICLKYINESSLKKKSKSFLNEQEVTNFDKVYDYKKDYDNISKTFKYFFKRKGDLNWVPVTEKNNPKAFIAIKTNVFNDKPTATKNNTVLKSKIPVSPNTKTQEKNPFTQDLSTRKDTFSHIDRDMKLKSEASIAEQAIKKTLNENGGTIPLHIKCMMWFLVGRVDPLTEDSLTNEEKTFLWESSINYGLKNGFRYNYWKSIGAGELPTAVTQGGINKDAQTKNPGLKKLINPGIAGEMMYTLGEVSKSNIKLLNRDTIHIHDNYDFNTKEYGLTKEDVINNVNETLKKYRQGNAGIYSVVRQLMPLRELGGYNGFPINLTIINPNKTV